MKRPELLDEMARRFPETIRPAAEFAHDVVELMKQKNVNPVAAGLGLYAVMEGLLQGMEQVANQTATKH